MSAALAAVLQNTFNAEPSHGLLAASPVTAPYRPVIDRMEDMHIRKIRVCFKKDRELTSNKKKLQEVISSFEREKKYTGHISIDVDPA
jgi:hypothetical protein